jgi:hypothetical protein
VIFPRHQRHGHRRRLGDLTLRAVLDVARARISAGRRIRRVARDAAQIKTLDAQGVADAEDQSHIRQTAHVVEHDADRHTRQPMETTLIWLARDEFGGGERGPGRRRRWRQIGSQQGVYAQEYAFRMSFFESFFELRVRSLLDKGNGE